MKSSFKKIYSFLKKLHIPVRRPFTQQVYQHFSKFRMVTENVFVIDQIVVEKSHQNRENLLQIRLLNLFLDRKQDFETIFCYKYSVENDIFAVSEKIAQILMPVIRIFASF